MGLACWPDTSLDYTEPENLKMRRENKNVVHVQEGRQVRRQFMLIKIHVVLTELNASEVGK